MDGGVLEAMGLEMKAEEHDDIWGDNAHNHGVNDIEGVLWMAIANQGHQRRHKFALLRRDDNMVCHRVANLLSQDTWKYDS